jgi:hypothetical protein
MLKPIIPSFIWKRIHARRWKRTPNMGLLCKTKGCIL